MLNENDNVEKTKKSQNSQQGLSFDSGYLTSEIVFDFKGQVVAGGYNTRNICGLKFNLHAVHSFLAIVVSGAKLIHNSRASGNYSSVFILNLLEPLDSMRT